MAKKLALILFLIILLLSTFVPPAISASSAQTWYLTPVDYVGPKANDGTEHHHDKVMSKTPVFDDHVAFTSAKTMWWYAENPAECSLSFGVGTWRVHLYHDKMDQSDEYGQTLTADIFKVASDGSATQIATGSSITTPSSTDTVIVCSPLGTHDFAAGERLAVRISWSSTNQLWIYYSSTKPSTLQSPSSDPGYPVPELPGFALLAAGLLILIPLILSRRARNTQITS